MTINDTSPVPTVAVLTALPLESVAMKAMLDNPQDLSLPGRAPAEYVVGTIPSKDGGKHTVLLSPTNVAENLAAANTALLLERFPNISTVIMVGIAGGVPDPSDAEADIRLGDVVVCGPNGTVQYDYDKESTAKGLTVSEPRHPPRPPSYRLLQAHSELQAKALEGTSEWTANIDRPSVKVLSSSTRPSTDALHHWESPFHELERAVRPSTPKVFTGIIASGNKLLKNANFRETLRTKFRAKAVEMEASGVADASWLLHAGYFVVRGICDYCDSFKNDDWQQYSAIVAAAYTRGLLEQTRSELDPQSSSQRRGPLSGYDSLPTSLRTALENEAGDSGQARLLAETLDETLVACRRDLLDVLDVSHGANRQHERPALVLDSFAKNISAGVVPKLSLGDLLLGAALPSFVGTVRARWINAQFEAPANEDWFAEVAATMALDGQMSAIPESAGPTVVQSAIERVARRRQSQWDDNDIRSRGADAKLSRWMAADPHVCAAIRAIAGDMAAFQHLPEAADFWLGPDQHFDVHWKNLASSVCLSELRVLGTHLLPADVMEDLIHLPNAADQIAALFEKAIVVNNDQNDWIVRATCEEPVLDHSLRECVRILNDELSQRRPMSDHLTRNGGRAFPIVGPEIAPQLVNGTPRYTTPHVHFSLSASHARKLFMGSDLWGDPEFAYRELFQNALDACRYRAARSKHLDIRYLPLIKIFHGRDTDGNEFVECEDNGIGMDRALIASCFSTAGNRFTDTEEYRRERDSWRARGIEHNVNSQFGIGVFSYFLVADRLEVETARLTADGEVGTRFLLTIPTSSSFFRIISISTTAARAESKKRSSERGIDGTFTLDAGTRVRLTLRKTLAGGPENMEARRTCVDALRDNVWYSEVLTEICDYRGQSLTLHANELAQWIGDAEQIKDVGFPFWWLPTHPQSVSASEGKPRWLFCSRNGGSKAPDRFRSFGRVLVDGLVTDVVTPGFIVNFAGSATPQLSLDRRQIRSDIRADLEEIVEKALGSLPTEVSANLLEDLWYWNPRACHAVCSTRGRRWYKRNLRIESGGAVSEDVHMRGSFLPPLPERVSFFNERMDATKVVVDLWQIAKETPEARGLSRFALASRGILETRGLNLSVIPEVLWKCLATMSLGIPEALALHYGFGQSHAAVLCAYVSWQSGDDMGKCAQRLASFAAVLGHPWPDEIPISDEVVSDYDAWILGCGDVKSPWSGPELKTYDICRFCARTGKTIAEALPSFVALAKKINWKTDIDESLANEVGTMDDRDLRFAQCIERDFSYIDPPELDANRSLLLCRLVGRNLPVPSPKRPGPTLNFEPEDEAIAKALGWTTNRLLGLAEAWTLARSMQTPPLEAVASIRRIAIALGREVAFDEQQDGTLALFAEKHWYLAEGAGFLGRRQISAPGNTLELAQRLAGNRYSMYGQTAPEIFADILRVYEAFRWGSVPLSERQIQLAMELDRNAVDVLERVPPSGRLDILRILMTALDTGRPMHLVAASAEELLPFGVQLPLLSDSYLGIEWGAIIAST